MTLIKIAKCLVNLVEKSKEVYKDLCSKRFFNSSFDCTFIEFLKRVVNVGKVTLVFKRQVLFVFCKDNLSFSKPSSQ